VVTPLTVAVQARNLAVIRTANAVLLIVVRAAAMIETALRHRLLKPPVVAVARTARSHFVR
jgi:hypothetical protein